MSLLFLLRVYPGGISQLIKDTKLAKATIYAHAAGDKPFSEDVCTRIANCLDAMDFVFPPACILDGEPTYLGAVIQLWAAARKKWLMNELSKTLEIRLQDWN